MGFFNKYKAVRDAPIIDADEFFSETVLPVREVQEKKGFKVVAGALVGMLFLSVFAGGLASLPAMYALSATAQVIEEPIEYWKNLPEDLDDVVIAEHNKMYDVNGNMFAEFWSEDRVKLNSLDEISQYAKDALVSTEDHRFYEHGGFDPRGTVRAALSRSGGGSGITQQLVKNLQFYNQAGLDNKETATEQSIERKIKELKYAMGYEKTHTKDEILLTYFNTVAFGSPNIYSIESASKFFFGKSAKDLSIAEAAALVGTVQNPVAYDMTTDENTEEWKERQLAVLDRMVIKENITQDEADAAYAEQLTFTRQKSSGNCASSAYPFYCEYVIDYLKNSPQFGETPEERSAILARGGLNIKTHLDPRVMDSIDNRLEQDFGNDNRVVAPVAVVEPGTGGVQGIGVNRDYGDGPGQTTINVALNPTATGSTYKAITLAAAVRSGMDESDLAFSSLGCPLNPSGYDSPSGGFTNSTSCSLQGGFMNYRNATALSSNTWYLSLAIKTGMGEVLQMSKDLGLSVPENISERSLSFVLGSVENSPVNMAAAYAAFASEGTFCPATPVSSYEYDDGTRPAVPDTYDPELTACKKVMSPYAASTVLKSLRANTVPGDVGAAFGTMGYIPGYDAVGKTGTNETYNYAWAQVSPDYSLFMDVYDMTDYTVGVLGNTYYKGSIFSQNVAAYAGSDVMRDVLSGTPYSSLNYNATDKNMEKLPVDKRDFFTVPSVAGVAPAEALATMETLGIPANVSKETRPAPAGYPSGVIVEQSLQAGTQLPVGTKKEIVLYVSE